MCFIIYSDIVISDWPSNSAFPGQTGHVIYISQYLVFSVSSQNFHMLRSTSLCWSQSDGISMSVSFLLRSNALKMQELVDVGGEILYRSSQG